MSFHSSTSFGEPITPVSSSGMGMNGLDRPAKLGIQTPSGKILRLMKKGDHMSTSKPDGDVGEGSVWETIIKVSERGVWRGLVLADRTARWCVFAEWECA
jgi:transglutaminase/protease-like cytokinesis protein 3